MDIHRGEPGKINLKCPGEGCGAPLPCSVEILYTATLDENSRLIVAAKIGKIDLAPFIDHGVFEYGWLAGLTNGDDDA